jgi:hypothetical protein
MNKTQAVSFGIRLMLLFTGIALSSSTTLTATSDVIIYAFHQNPAGSDEGNELVTFHNPSNESVDIGNLTFESTHGSTANDWIAEGTTLYPLPWSLLYILPFLSVANNSEEVIILKLQMTRNS